MDDCVSLAPFVATIRDDEPSRLGGMTGLLGGIGGGTPRPSGGFVADFLLAGLPPAALLSFSAAFGGLIVAILVACCGKTDAGWLCEMAGVLCSFRGPGLVVANPLVVLSSVVEFALSCWPLIMDRATPVAEEEV